MMSKLLTPEQFGKTFDPPKATVTILRWCRDNRISGAYKLGGRWVIPKNARVYQLLYEDKIEGAAKTDWGWNIPKDAPWPSEQAAYA
jgi:hypothetical protein